MLDQWKTERELRVKAGALIGAVWLVTLSAVSAYARTAPTPESTAAAVYGPSASLDVIGRAAC
ncbi:MAG: hypothetical protein ACXWCY_24950 [Burkholderiales bacterium]